MAQSLRSPDAYNFATNTPELARAFTPLIDKFQVEVFLSAMQDGGFTVEDMLSFQKDQIPTSLLKMDNPRCDIAIELFKMILKYIGVDTSFEVNQVEFVSKLIKLANPSSELLRDELFMQVLKQTRKNSDSHSSVKAWELMYLCASCMPPTKEVGDYMVAYICNVVEDANTCWEIQVIGNNTLNSLECSVKAGPRLKIPSHEEIEALLSGRELTTDVFFLDGRSRQITYDIATTVADAVKELAGIIKLSSYSSFSLFKCRKAAAGSESPDLPNEEYFGLDDNKYIGDILSDFKADRKKGEAWQLTFKRKLFRHRDESISNPMFVELSYIQLRHDYLLGYYFVGWDDAARLSALQIRVENGSSVSVENWDLGTLLERFLPRKFASTITEAGRKELEAVFPNYYHSMEKITSSFARQLFMRVLGRLSYGNSLFFPVSKINDPLSLKEKMVLGINWRGVQIYNAVPNLEVETNIAHIDEILKFDTYLTLKIKIDDEVHILDFETSQVKEIYDALVAYLEDYALQEDYLKNRNNEERPLESTSVLREQLHAKKEDNRKHNHKIRLLEERLARLERKDVDETNFEHERNAIMLNHSQLEELEELRKTKKMHEARLVEMDELYKKEVALRKEHFNQIQDMKGKIRVYCRWRPLNKKETSNKERNVLTRIDDFTVQLEATGEHHLYDRVFDDGATQEDVCKETLDLIQSAVDGYNVCIFAYGQSGSGKTFTLYGPKDNPGLIPRAMSELFVIMNRDKRKYAFKLKAYMVELYNETFIDLLLPSNEKLKGVQVDEFCVDKATTLDFSTLDDLISIMKRGLDGRKTSQTAMNDKSSRSHLIFSIFIESTNIQTQDSVAGKLSFVDLAGSESLGDNKNETTSINKSLLALGRVFKSLAENKTTYIPYRDSKLTHLLKDSIGGNAKALMFVNLSPAESNQNVSNTALKYADNVRAITNKPQKNEPQKKRKR